MGILDKLLGGGGETGQSAIPAGPSTVSIEAAGTDAESKDLQEVKLKLALKSRSKRPVLKSNQGVKTAEVWAGYTMILPVGEESMIIVDQNGVKVEDFKNRGHMHFRDALTDIVKSDGKEYISKVPSSEPSDFFEGRLPTHLQPYARAFCGASQFKKVPMIVTNLHLKNPKITVLLGGRFIMISAGDPALLIAYQTTNSAGTFQPPQNWHRFDMGSKKKWPPELLECMGQFYPFHHGMKNVKETDYWVMSNVKGLYVGRSEVSSSETEMKWIKQENTPNIGSNVCFDRENPQKVYYCRSDQPAEIRAMDLSKPREEWNSGSTPLPGAYEGVRDLSLDPSGQFFIFLDDKDRMIILDKENLKEIARFGGIKYFRFNQQGEIQLLTKNGHWNTYHANFSEVHESLEAKKTADAIGGLDVGEYFRVAGSTVHRRPKQGGVGPGVLAAYNEVRDKLADDFRPEVDSAVALGDLDVVREALVAAKRDLVTKGLELKIVEYITGKAEESIIKKATQLAQPELKTILGRVRSRLQSLAVATLAEARDDVTQAQRYSAYVDATMQGEIRNIAAELHNKATEIFRTQAASIENHAHTLIRDTREALEKMDNKPDFDRWHEFSYPQLKKQLRTMADECLVELPGTRQKILDTVAELDKLAQNFEGKFAEEYSLIREAARERTEGKAAMIESDIKGFIERMMRETLRGRDDAETYASQSAIKNMIERDITDLESRDSSRAKGLRQLLHIKLANAYGEIERRARIGMNAAGHQMVLFGNVPFPRWEGHVKRQEKPELEVAFRIDDKTRGPGIGADDLFGDIIVNIKSSTGTLKSMRLFENLPNEDNWRMGHSKFGGTGRDVVPSYIKSGDYRRFYKNLRDWQRGDRSNLRVELERMRSERAAHYKKRKSPKNRPDPGDSDYDQWEKDDQIWQTEYRRLIEEYNKFFTENFITHLMQVDKLGEMDFLNGTNGKGYVPEWQPHWTSDHQTESMLGKMAELSRMQLDLQEGLLNLKGHAGTGKDVLVKMFCSRTNRPYFSMDCSKWTTEFELSEDIILESVDGASQTIQVPSVVLQAIQTPGAVMYFNEINAMPEQSQIFLHALMDEKRSLTLKTSAGRTVKAHPSVIMMGSMNPGYPGTFAPQFATRSRMVSLEVDYAPFQIPAKTGESLVQPRINPSEPLRVARSVDSLAEFTFDPDPDRNEFVQIWDAYVNGVGTLSNLTPTQKFDLGVILALVTFASRFRDDFVKKFEGGRDARNALPVTQPITLREMRRCAHALSQIPDTGKVGITPGNLAKELIAKFYFCNIDSREDRTKLEGALIGFTYSKRLGVR